MKKFLALALISLTVLTLVKAQNSTFPYNGVQDHRSNSFALTNVTIQVSADKQIKEGTVLVKDGKIVRASRLMNNIPSEYKVLDMKGKYIYPSFIELYSEYGLEKLKSNFDWDNYRPKFVSDKKGAYGWNMAIKPEINAADHFSNDQKEMVSWRKNGFGAVLTHQNDGIMRGTGALIALVSDKDENQVIISDKAASFYSFEKGSSDQDYPNSLMGSIALLRQTFYDAKWYKNNKEETNLSLEAVNETELIPGIFKAGDRLDVLRADKLGDEFNKQFIFKTGNDSYKRLDHIKSTNAPLIISINYPDTYNVKDAFDAKLITYAELKHWDLAPSNPKWLDEEGIKYCFTTDGLKDKGNFIKNIKKAIDHGLSYKTALKAVSQNPASFINQQNKMGQIKKGFLANFIITTDSLFTKEAKILENWVKGNRYIIDKNEKNFLKGIYELNVSDSLNYTLKISNNMKKGKPSFSVVEKDSTIAKVNTVIEGTFISLSFKPEKEENKIRLSGYINEDGSLKGKGNLISGEWVNWSARKIESVKDYEERFKKEEVDSLKSDDKNITDATEAKEKKDDNANIEKTDKEEKEKIKDRKLEDEVMYPFVAYGNKANGTERNKSYLFKNATVWTNESQGILENTDVLISQGKISRIGNNLSSYGAEVVDAKGKHLTCGIIDEHSHIAISKGVNEGTQASSAEVSISDVINSEDINIYRQLAGGVVAAQLLHGSANPIGGQSGIIKFRWGAVPEEMKIKDAPGFIKFALGENVKQSNWGDRSRTRFPQSRMGVEQVYVDHFTRAKKYMNDNSSGKRKDLELETLAEILQKKRFITCHSYVQSEITMLMRVAEQFDFRINTFTHILEGYKIADKMREHGVNASSFSDWWRYKYEVMDAIPYNGAILSKMGVNTSFNSDDAEMARRLNQEAAKAIKYGNMSEEEAWKFVTLNPAKMLHIDHRMGSIKIGKDADVVLWNNNPLSTYASADMTFVDGKLLFSKSSDLEKRKHINKERNRLIQKMISDNKKSGNSGKKPKPKNYIHYHCDDVQGINHDH